MTDNRNKERRFGSPPPPGLFGFSASIRTDRQPPSPTLRDLNSLAGKIRRFNNSTLPETEIREEARVLSFSLLEDPQLKGTYETLRRKDPDTALLILGFLSEDRDDADLADIRTRLGLPPEPTI